MARRRSRRRTTRRARHRRAAPAAWAAALILALSALGVFGVWLLLIFPHRGGEGEGQIVELQVGERDDVADVVGRLHAEGLVAEPWLFRLYVALHRAEPRLRRGEVLVTDDMTHRVLLRRLAEGYGPAEVRITFPEGFTRFQIAERLQRWDVCETDEFLAASEDPQLLDALEVEASTAEGYLFPDTYRLHDQLGASAIVRRMVGNWRRKALQLLTEHTGGFQRLRDELGWGLDEVVTLASIVQEEAAVAQEMPVIAGVFLNRLTDEEFKPRRLQADPTVSYGCLVNSLASCLDFDGRNITRGMLDDASNPYNTYRIDGLPPGPISNPGKRAIAAVLDPAEHEYLYFVARGDGRHHFSAGLREHQRATERYRARFAGADGE